MKNVSKMTVLGLILTTGVSLCLPAIAAADNCRPQNRDPQPVIELSLGNVGIQVEGRQNDRDGNRRFDKDTPVRNDGPRRDFDQRGR
jgi:hypothetical protein